MFFFAVSNLRSRREVNERKYVHIENTDYGCTSAGQGIGLLKEVLPVEDVIGRFVQGAERLLKRWDA